MTYPQPAGSVELKFELPVSTSPTGVELVFGATVIPAEPQDLIPGSATHTAFGDHLVYDPRVLAAGFDTAEFGTAAIELETPNIYPEGFDASEFGDAYIADKPEPTQVTFNSDDPGIGGAYGFESGDAFVNHFLRYIEVNYPPQEEWGTAFIGERYRYLYPDGTTSNNYGDIEVTFPKQLLPLGLDATRYGDAEVDFHNVAFPPGTVMSALGQPFVAFRRRNVVPFAQQYIEWGEHKVDLWQRYLQVTHPPESNADGELWGQYTEVLNRNRTVGPVGLLSQKISTSPAYLELTGRAIQPPSIDDGAFGEDTFASYRIRSMQVFGYEVDRYPNNTYVFNNAATIRPVSLNSFAAGTPFVEKLLKFVTHSGFRTDGYGTQWASFKVREVRPVGPDVGGRNNAHYISHTPYLVQFAGFNNLRTGGPFVFIRPPITVYASWIQPWVQDQKQMGIPAVRRYPPLIEVPGRPYTEFSYPAARVDFRVRTLQPPSVAGQERWGTPVIRDRKFTVSTVGISTAGYGQATVENVLTIVAPTTRTIFAFGGTLSEYGANLNVEQRWLNVESLGDATQYGETKCQNNAILFESKHHPSVTGGMTSFGMTTIPGWQAVEEVGAGYTAGYGHPGMSPFHVYCTPAYPLNYDQNLKQNNGGMVWEPPDADLIAKYGSTVALHPRTVYLSAAIPDDSAHKPSFGVPTLYFGTQEVFPLGLHTFRAGVPDMWPHPQDVGLRGMETLEFGSFEVPAPYSPYVYPAELDALRVGGHTVDYRHRKLRATGIDHSVLYANYSNPGYNNLYYPIVGDWLRVTPSYEAAEYGSARVSNYRRYVYPEPTDGEWGDTVVQRETQTVFCRGDEYGEYGVFDNTREMTIRPYSVRFFCPTSPYTQVLHV